MASTYESARYHPALRSVLRSLVINLFTKEYDLPENEVEIAPEDFRKAAWLATICANSDSEKHQFIAATFAKLTYLQSPTDESKTQLAYTILSRTGNLAATRHLETVFEETDQKTDDKQFKKSFGYALDLELGTKRNLNRIEIENHSYFVTDFQRKLWDNLQKHEYIAISAPTSAGKSFFIQHFIGSLFAQHEEFEVLYIVPTKALISQSSETFRKMLKGQDVTVKTAFVEEPATETDKTTISSKSKKEIYCVTPERCLKLIQQGRKGNFRPNLIFVDEIQNVETNDNRAVLFEYVLAEFTKIWIAAKILFAGPFIKNGKELYKKLISLSAEEVTTYLPPVYQLRLTVRVKKNGFKVIIHLGKGNEQHEIEIEQNINLGTGSSKFFLAPVVARFGKGDGSLIYAAQSNYCESYAIEFIKELKTQGKGNQTLHPAVLDLMELLKDEIHPNYYLIYCLKYKVAFHHGKLPDMVKAEIEYLFEQGYIDYLFCTSTLLQGVNLPAPRMFLISPAKATTPFSPFEFGNLIGRAGRIKNSMVGTVICVESDPENPWSLNYFNVEYTKEVVPTTDRALKKTRQEIIDTLAREPRLLKHTGEEYTGVLLKQKYLRGEDALQSYLQEKEVDENTSGAILTEVSRQFGETLIPPEVAELNPTIDPILQNELYKQIKEDGIRNWVLLDENEGNHNYSSKRVTRQEAEQLPYDQRSFYFQFESLLVRMDKVFAIWKEASMRRVSMGTRKMAYYGVTWLNSLPISKLIENDFEYYKVDMSQPLSVKKLQVINSRINGVININSVIVTYILVKYFKLLADILESQMTDAQKEQFGRTLRLPTMLELGTRKIEVLIMVSLGIPRAIALKVAHLIPESQRETPIQWLESLTTLRSLRMKRFYLKYLYRKGYLPNLRDEEIKRLSS